jgi:hypothetical protein
LRSLPPERLFSFATPHFFWPLFLHFVCHPEPVRPLGERGEGSAVRSRLSTRRQPNHGPVACYLFASTFVLLGYARWTRGGNIAKWRDDMEVLVVVIICVLCEIGWEIHELRRVIEKQLSLK